MLSFPPCVMISAILSIHATDQVCVFVINYWQSSILWQMLNKKHQVSCCVSPPLCCYQVLDSLRSGTSPPLNSIYCKDATSKTMMMRINTLGKGITIFCSFKGPVGHNIPPKFGINSMKHTKISTQKYFNVECWWQLLQAESDNWICKLRSRLTSECNWQQQSTSKMLLVYLFFSGMFALCFFLICLLCFAQTVYMWYVHPVVRQKVSVDLLDLLYLLDLLDLCLKRSLFFFLRRARTTKKLAQRHLIKATTVFFAAVLSAFKSYCPGQDFLLPLPRCLPTF